MAFALTYGSLYERLVANVKEPESENGCWEHQGQLQRPVHGYPRVSLRVNGKHVKRFAHRLMDEIVNGPLPEGLEIDHICFNHRCVNPDHLQRLTRAENLARIYKA